MSVKDQLERLTEELHPEPPELISIVMLRFIPIEHPEDVRLPLHYVGRFAVCTFIGGTEKEQRRELKRLRESGLYNRLQECARPAIAEGEETAEALPAGRGEGNGKALREGHG